MPVSDNPNIGSNSNRFPLISKPGIKRDGTVFDGNNWTDGQWTRFQRGKPRKIGGYRSINERLIGPVRTLFVHSTSGNNRIFCGAGTALQYVDTSADGIGGGVADITPSLADGFVPSNYNTWQFAELYDSTSVSSRLLAHAAPNLRSIDSTVTQRLWFGDIDGSAPLIDTTAPDVSGGVCTAAPYAFVYGDNGYIAWCVPNLPDDWLGAGSGEARVTRTKIVYGSAVRGGAGQSPALLLISLDSVLRVTFSGGATVFDFDTISSQSSILSSAGVIEYDGIFFWAGIDRFLLYNGVVQELPNDMNTNWFFENLNYAQRQKVWATKVPRFGEIWWHYPRGNSTECNATIIFNIKEQTWYDTSIERTAGFYPQVFRWPVWADVDQSPVQVVRPFSGTAATSDGGTAALAFDNNLATSCTQTAPDGNISYDFGQDVTQTVVKVGFAPTTTGVLQLVFEYSDDNFENWQIFYEVEPESFNASTIYTFDLSAPVTARGFRIRERGGHTLDLEEVYFLGRGYMIHQHEYGVDRIVNSQVQAIRAFIEAADVAYIAEGPMGDRWMGVNRWVNIECVEPDAIQVGEMTFTLIMKKYARSEAQVVTRTFDPDTERMDISYQGRIMRMRFTSNTQGGDFQLGQFVFNLLPGDSSQ